jgi:5-methyltetrahydrofolate corrinoid/iron sulfur protein methyltransferase
MIVIADNLNTRNRRYMAALEQRDQKALAGMAKELADSHADLINVQCSLDGAGDEERLPWAAEVVENASGLGISLDSRNMEALKKAFAVIKNPPLINYLSLTEPENRGELLSIATRERANLVLRASKGSIPMTFEGKLQILEELLEAANAADIPNERLFLDPSVVHIAKGAGQDHIVNVRECILAIQELIEPPANSIVWISNISVGMPRRERKQVEAAFLLYLAGAGLDAAMVDVLDPQVKRALYLVKSFKDEIIFTPADMEVHAQA